MTTEMGGTPEQPGRMWGGVRGEEKWRPDRTNTPEWCLREGRSSLTWRDSQGARRIWGGVEGVYPTHSGPGKPAGLLGLVVHSPGPPLGRVGLGRVGPFSGSPSGLHRREAGGEEERQTGKGPQGSEDQGRRRGHFLHPLGAREAC